MATGLKKIDFQNLTNALESLPPELVCLREVIQEAASQDQDLLGCGEGDMTTFERIWNARSEDANPEAHADLLQGWSDRFEQAAWLSPAYWVVGLLRGVSMFGSDSAIAATVAVDFLPPVTMNIPPGTEWSRTAGCRRTACETSLRGHFKPQRSPEPASCNISKAMPSHSPPAIC